MAVVKLHNPELAKNAVFKNLVVERVDSDPTVDNSMLGRIWFNNTEKTFKGVFVDADGNLVIKKIGLQDEVEQLQADLAQEIQDRQNADAELQTNIDNLANDVSTNYLNKTTTDEQVINSSKLTLAGELYVNGNVTFNGGTITEVATEQLKVSDNIITLNSDVPADVDPTENAGIEINRGTEGIMPFIIWDEANDVAKVVVGKDADGNWVLDTIATGGNTDDIQAELDKTQAGAGLADDGSYQANVDANYIANATSLADADNKLDAQVKANADAIANETSRAQSVEGNLADLTTDAKDNLVAAINEVDSHADKVASDLATEVTNRQNADNAIQSELDKTQAGAGLADDGSYQANADANYIADATSLADADNKLDAQVKANADAIANETSRAQNAESNIQSELDNTQTGAGLADDGSYQANANANYIADAVSLADADNKLDAQVKANADAIADEVSRAQNAESNIQSELDNTQTGAGLAEDGSYQANASANYISDATSLADADNKLDAQVKANADAIANEVSRAQTAESNIQSELDNTQTGAGLADDGSYQANANANFIADATSLADADNKLDASLKATIDDLANNSDAAKGSALVGYVGYTESDTTITNPVIGIDAGSVKTAIDTIASKVNAKFNELENMIVKGEVSADNASDSYTITHNLGTVFVDVAVQVYDDADGTWRFDLVVVEVVDENTVTITLADGNASPIRYVIQGF
jgi:hypothetical protein